jgi:hypothetical protein
VSKDYDALVVAKGFADFKQQLHIFGSTIDRFRTGFMNGAPSAGLITTADLTRG